MSWTERAAEKMVAKAIRMGQKNGMSPDDIRAMVLEIFNNQGFNVRAIELDENELRVTACKEFVFPLK